MKRIIVFSVLAVCLMLCTLDTSAQVKTRVRFPAGTHGTSVKGTVRGYDHRDYVVGAAAGQTITVKLNHEERSSVFTIFQPNGDNLDTAAEQNNYSGELPVKGDYVVRVLMMRNEARRKGSISNYTLKITIK